MIKHLIISGGDLSVFAMLGALDILIEKYNEYDPDNIENIYSVSAGSMIGLLICLKISFKTINNYFIERPWNKLINISTQDILNIFNTRGVLDVHFLYETYKINRISGQITLYEHNIYKTGPEKTSLDKKLWRGECYVPNEKPLF